MIVLQWRQSEPAFRTRWRGPVATLVPPDPARPAAPLAAIIGPPGAAGPAPRAGSVTLALPQGMGTLHAEQSFPAPGLTPAMRAFAALAPAEDADENCGEFLAISALTARASTDSIQISLTLAEPASGPVSLVWSAF